MDTPINQKVHFQEFKANPIAGMSGFLTVHFLFTVCFSRLYVCSLQESVFALSRKVGKARLECIMEVEQPKNENVARRAGITIEKLARLRAKTRIPRSMQDRVWSDDGVTYQVL